MYPETKEAVRRAMRVCRILWGMDPEEYDRLLKETDAIEFPSRSEITERLHDRFRDEVIGGEEFANLVEAELVGELKTKYSKAASDAGLDPEQGLAMLEYAAILRDLEDEDGYGENK